MIPAMRASTARAVARLAAIAAIAVTLGVPAAAIARAERTVGHPMARVWPTAVRYLRVDEGLEIVDKDAEAGYVVFDLKDKGRTFRGYLELVEITDDDGHRGVRLVLSVEGRPEYTESGLLDRLLDKIHREYGDPEPAKPEPDPAPAPAPKPAPRKPPPA
jgi:hypothetical protein